MALPMMPHPHLIVLRSAATVVLSCLIAQAGWAAAVLGGEAQFARNHEVGAWVTLAATVGSALLYVLLRTSAGAVNVALAVVLAGAVVAQFTLGHTGQRALHIFLGVLVAMLGTALTSWTYRHALPEDPGA
ncbi:hypothetical protein ACI3ET_08030 [Ornithinimicrobium sp. LYQ121]|uniref:hypothetical protein n=1 Tax=Ornithinimicrobium sp. LYQ121 TaxID=3378801 RepID=UPI0038548456